MREFGVPEEFHLRSTEGLDLERQFPLAIGTIGDFASEIVRFHLDATQQATPVDEVQFAVQVLLAIADANMASTAASLVRLIAASALLLADSPGRAAALCKQIKFEDSLEYPLESCLLAALSRPWQSTTANEEVPPQASALLSTLQSHYQGQASAEALHLPVRTLRRWSYDSGAPRELLLADLLSAVAMQRSKYSARTCLPRYTGQADEVWDGYLKRTNAIRDFWPAQRMLGEAGVFRGESAVVQMPTSTGKTRATEMVIRAAFVSGRTSIAVVVAPFRALCYEIAHDLKLKFEKDGYQVNQLSDAIQQDYAVDFDEFLRTGIEAAPHVIVVTPEKLLYVIRHEEFFMENVGLMVYDEGHQFDSPTRGVTYELLLASVKASLSPNAQTVLISAVVNNAAELAGWLLPHQQKVVSDSNSQTARYIAFTTFQNQAIGQLRFESAIRGEQEFFVPRVVKRYRLTGEDAPTHFPMDDSGSIALYLGLNLASQGGVAIYVRAPDSATKIIRDAVEKVFPRASSLPRPQMWADESEVSALARLYEANFGEKSFLTKAAEFGLYAHTGDTPEGIRLAIEHAMRESLIGFVVCTSTLAQGVNLPIKYLLVTQLTAGERPLRTRDFQNLIGRAGRAGMYADGTVIFTNPNLYDERKSKARSWRSANALLDPKKAAPTTSALLSLTRPLKNRFESEDFPYLTVREILDGLIEEPARLFNRIDEFSPQLEGMRFDADDLKRQLRERLMSVKAVECFLMAQLADKDAAEAIGGVARLANSTFAYHLASPEQRKFLLHAFMKIWSRISGQGLSAETLARYGRGILGLIDAIAIDALVRDKLFELQLAESPEDLLDVVWAFIVQSDAGKKLRKLDPADSNRLLVNEWITGKPFKDIMDALTASGTRIQWGQHTRDLTFDQLVDLCQDQIGYQACLVLASIASSFEAQTLASESQAKTVALFNRLLKMLKYGLAEWEQISVYEAGFAERVIATKLSGEIPKGTFGIADVKRELLRRKSRIRSVLEHYPSYFSAVFQNFG
nr:DEAD/DEAH box helicase [uncultured Caldimonas sp.]